MANEISAQNFGVDYVPAKLEIKNFDEIKKEIGEYASKFEGLVVTEETFQSVKDVRKELNDKAKAISQRRIEIKNSYNEPYDKLKEKTDSLEKIILDVNSNIDKSIKDYEQSLRDKKRVLVEQLISSKADEYGLEQNDYPVLNTKWLNASQTLSKTSKELDEYYSQLIESRKKVIEDKAAIEKYATAFELDPTGWIALVDTGYSAAEIMERINKAVADKKAKEAREAEIKEQEKVIKNVKPEIVEQKQEQSSEKPVQEVFDVYLTLFGITGKQTTILREFMDQNDIKWEMRRK